MRRDFEDAENQVFGRYSLTPTARRFSIQRPQLAVRALDVGTGETAIFLHGFALGTAHWAPLIARLPLVRRVMLDMPGHGATDPVDFRNVELRGWFKDMLSSCLDELGIASAHIVGHSQGAMFALWLALDAPTRVSSVVAIGTPAVAFGADLRGLRFLTRPGIGPLMSWLSVRSPLPAYGKMMAANMGLRAVADYPEIVRTTQLGNRRAGFATTISTYLGEMFRGAAAQPRRYVLSDDELSRIQQRVLVIWGSGDSHYQTPAAAREKVSRIPNGRFELVPGGHEPWLDDADRSAELISAFLGA